MNKPSWRQAPLLTMPPLGQAPPRRPQLPALEIQYIQSSSNPYVNGSGPHNPEDGVLCISCGEAGHVAKGCTGPALVPTEQKALYKTLFSAHNHLGEVPPPTLRPQHPTGPLRLCPAQSRIP